VSQRTALGRHFVAEGAAPVTVIAKVLSVSRQSLYRTPKVLRHMVLAALLIALGFSPSALAPASAQPLTCPVSTVSAIRESGDGSQLVSVTTRDTSSTIATLETWSQVNGCWQRVAGPFVARIGRRGMSAHHREGDGSTPMGIFSFGPKMYGNSPSPGVSYPYVRLTCGDWWDEDPRSRTYNEFVHVRCGTNPAFNDGNSEPLWLERSPYPFFAVIAYNPTRIAGLGSGIFLHADTGSSTAGCIALPLTQLREVLRWLAPASNPHIVVEKLNEPLTK
jgi:L,D-peptidoglycan transpeptidase YkuD (ErfK/YbiS/YcfS/YnhG family)